MKITPIILTCACLFLLCSCATMPVIQPAEVNINKDAGRGSVIIINLHLKGGKELPFMVDTGNPVTTLDTSLEPKLGKCQGTNEIWNFGETRDIKIYAAPDLYLG